MDRFDRQMSPAPEVRLINYFPTPYDNAVAAARTCYSSVVVRPEDVRKTEKARRVRDKIMESIYAAGHHTTIQHPTFQFVLERVSRQFLWSFLHSHPFYNSEQVSQRYVEVKAENFATPPLNEKAGDLYRDVIKKQMDGYFRLIELLTPDVREEFFRIYPARRKEADAWAPAIHKKTIECARYVLPVATHAHLYHTVSGLTLHRYHKASLQLDAPLETRVVVRRMIDEVNKVDPLFFRNLEEAIPLEETPEFRMTRDGSGTRARRFVDGFDASLGAYRSRLVDYKVNGERVMAQGVRTVLGIPDDGPADAEAIDRVMNPAAGPYMSGALNVKTLSKLSRVMVHPHFTFRKKLSHTADSQDQRHRMTPASRPVLASHFVHDHPDYLLPTAIERNGACADLVARLMDEVWKGIAALIDMGSAPEDALYLLPNAFPIRFEESGDLLNFHHKWTTRLCYLAQEEIWRSCLEEVRQVRAIHPNIGRHIAAPCALRKTGGEKPYCPEGDRFCGVPVWDLELDDYTRRI